MTCGEPGDNAAHEVPGVGAILFNYDRHALRAPSRVAGVANHGDDRGSASRRECTAARAAARPEQDADRRREVAQHTLDAAPRTPAGSRVAA